jgi:predicted small metal-binding protein
MAHIIDCGKVNPASGCGHVISGKTAAETLRLAAEHARREHGLKPTPELMAVVQQHMTTT